MSLRFMNINRWHDSSRSTESMFVQIGLSGDALQSIALLLRRNRHRRKRRRDRAAAVGGMHHATAREQRRSRWRRMRAARFVASVPVSVDDDGTP
jgi:hypothetical protein